MTGPRRARASPAAGEEQQGTSSTESKGEQHARKRHQARVGLRDLFLVVWGAVSLGLAIREQQGGPQIATAISTIAGGAIIIAASVYFGQLDTSWLPA